jgi:hypothetical protein
MSYLLKFDERFITCTWAVRQSRVITSTNVTIVPMVASHACAPVAGPAAVHFGWLSYT